MVRGIVTKGAFYWLRAPRNGADIRTDEWILAIIRVLLCVCFLGALVRPNSTYDLKAYGIIAFSYLAYSLLIVLLLYLRSHWTPFIHIGIHFVDIIWATQLIGLIEWPVMGFVIFLFIMASTAFRWGFWEAHLTLVIFSILLLFSVYHRQPDHLAQWISGGAREFLPEILLYFGVACMVGLLAEAKAVRSENQAIARTIQGINIESGLEQALRAVCNEGRRLFGATQMLLVTHDGSRNRSMMYRVVRPQSAIQSYELNALQMEKYNFPEPGISVRIATGPPPSPSPFRCLLFKEGKVKKCKMSSGPSEAFVSEHPFRTMLAIAASFEDNWTTHAYIIDPSPYLGGAAGLRFLDRASRQISPVIHNLFIMGRLKTKAKAIAGGQVARELHDGVIQTLSSILMQLETLRQQAGMLSTEDSDRLGTLQQSVQKEIAALRDFTQQLRSLEIDSRNLLSFLSGMAMKFQCEHGISTHFISEVNEVLLPAPVCVQLARIAQEGLTNIRKHSKAEKALVRFSLHNGEWKLSILDNGCGFKFSGRRSHEELEASGEGPQVLMERAKTIGGKISIESEAGSGSCLDIVFPA